MRHTEDEEITSQISNRLGGFPDKSFEKYSVMTATNLRTLGSIHFIKTIDCTFEESDLRFRRIKRSHRQFFVHQ
jgi:hypothetical protein